MATTPSTSSPTSPTRAGVSRRTAVAVGGVTLAGAALAACAAGPSTPVAPSAPASPPAPEPTQGAVAADAVSLAALDAVPVGGALAIVGPDGAPALLTRPTADTVVGLSALCPHKGCTVAPVTEGIECPCHSATFALDGALLGGPAKTGLTVFEVAVRDGQVVLA